MLRGGQGGAVRLKLYLAILWIAAKDPHDVSFPARAWAELLDLPDPSGGGQRRVRDAVAWLETEQFIEVERKSGRPPTIFLRREDGSGAAYSVPGGEARDENGDFPGEHIYVSIPPSFWTEGWAVVLSGAAIAIMLALFALDRGELEPLWISPGEARRRFSLSEDTWTKGTSELRDWGLLFIGRKPVSEDFGWRRMRNTYTLATDLTPITGASPTPPASLPTEQTQTRRPARRRSKRRPADG
jgi:hypothetical protein